MTESANQASPVTTTVPHNSNGFPVAEVKAARSIFRQSKLWWLTLICLMLSVWLAWQSLPTEGPSIVVQFPEGHGLKTGDTVRYRGIVVGTVTAVSLDSSLKEVEVSITFTPGGAALSCEGTRFWIVRPMLSLTEVSGLETAVGAKYIAVSPGDPVGPRKKSFEGLSAAPPDELGDSGLDIILQADNRYGVSIGAPVTWRGVDVGKVLAIGLAPDARHVNISVRILGSYRPLVKAESRFWVTSGFGVDVGLTGLKVNASSLQTIARGGISFTTPATSGNAINISAGHVFVLHDKADADWLNAADSVPLIDFNLPATVQIHVSKRTSLLGIPRTVEVVQTGTMTADGDSINLLTASLFNDDNPNADDNLPEFRVEGPGFEPVVMSDIKVSNCVTTPNGLITIPITDANFRPHVSDAVRRVATVPEDCVLVRSGLRDSQTVSVVEAISATQLQTTAEDQWQITDIDQDLTTWQGAPVIATVDGKIIGVLVNDRSRPTIALLR